MAKKDACYRKIMRRYKKWSARAAQSTAKCRKKKGIVRKTKSGSNLKRWGKEKWIDTRTGKPCGTGSKSEYCRPSKRVSSKTPVTKSEMSKSTLRKKQAEKKRIGKQGAGGKKVKAVRRNRYGRKK